MSQRALQETPIERIYREVTGLKMPHAIRMILLGKPRANPTEWEMGA